MYRALLQILNRVQSEQKFRATQQIQIEEQRARDITRLGRATHWRCEECGTVVPLGKTTCICRGVLVTGPPFNPRRLK